jgi:drug/metabolite transporter (DMT)-like permease
MLRIIIVIALATFCGAFGQILLRKGMQIVGPLETYMPLEVLRYFYHAILQPYVLMGTFFNAVMYGCLLAALSWTGVTVAFPLTALEYFFAAMLAMMILKEAVPPLRWAGIAFVILGVILISFSGESDTPQPSTDLDVQSRSNQIESVK